jgi:hypothetical protein
MQAYTFEEVHFIYLFICSLFNDAFQEVILAYKTTNERAINGL